MVDERRLKQELENYERFWGKHPEAVALLDAWTRTLDRPTYLDYIGNKEQLFFSGYNPMPDLERHMPLIRSAGHELAAVDALKKSSIFRQIILGKEANMENYQALHMAIASRLWRGPGHTFGEQELRVLYSTMDRFLRGGKDWHRIMRVPAATRQFYQSLSDTRLTVLFASGLCGAVEMIGSQRHGEKFAQTLRLSLPALNFVAAAAAIKNGRTKATLEDAVEGAWAYLRLFDEDLYSLPLVIREGSTGYEQSTSNR